MRSLTPALATLLLAGCASMGNRGPGGLGAKPLPRGAAQPAGPGARVAPGTLEPPSCGSRQYAFRCEVPQSYLLTAERRGPGTILTFEKRTRGSEEGRSLAVRATPLPGKSTLESFVNRRVARDLKKAQGVAKWSKQAATIGSRDGFELTVEKEYASGPYRSRIFLFQEGIHVFIVDQTGPAVGFDRENAALDSFVESLAFEGAPAP